MNKTELTEKMAARTGLTKKDCALALDAVLESIQDALSQEEKVALMGFGSFEVKNRAARTARNPRTGETVSLPESKAVSFHAGAGLKKVLEK